MASYVCLPLYRSSVSLSSVRLQSEGRVSFYCHYLWNCIPRRWMLSLTVMTSREAQSPPELFNMDAVKAHIHTYITSKHTLDVHTSKHTYALHTFHFCPKDNAWLVFCSCGWWRVGVTVLLSVRLMHYNTVLPCCVKSPSLLIENMATSHRTWYTSGLHIFYAHCFISARS